MRYLADGTLEAASGSSSTVVAFPYTGDYRIDTLVVGTENQSGISAMNYRWNYQQGLGSPVTVTYSFMAEVPWYGGNVTEDGDYGFRPFTAQQQFAAREIMARLQAELGINLVEVADSTLSYGEIRFGDNSQPTSAGYAWLPFSAGDERSGDVWLDQSVPRDLTQLAQDTHAWSTLVHEIGHALGLKHPGNYNAGQVLDPAPGNYLASAEDSRNYSIMSYTEAAGGQAREWFGMYDLLALKTLYGANTYNAGPTTYSYSDSSGRVLGIIDDASGYDTIDLSALTLGATIDLHAGAFSSVGRNGFQVAFNNLSIDLLTVIEKVIGTPYDDRVFGNNANNDFVLDTGNNAADGASGLDTVFYSAARAGYQVAIAGPYALVSGNGANDALTSMERLVFSDRKVAVDLGGNAGIAAKIIGAVFGAASVTSHPDFVGIGLYWLDAGTSYYDLMRYALDGRLGSGASNSSVVELLYSNLIGRPPAPDELALFKGWLDNGSLTQASLGVLAAELPQNQTNIDFAGLSARGLEFV